jgi:rhodanese-related sulfurtransferase
VIQLSHKPNVTDILSMKELIEAEGRASHEYLISEGGFLYMSESEYVFTVFKRYWKTLIKWLLHITGLPQITVDQLHSRIESSRSPLMIDIRSAGDFDGTMEGSYGHIPNARQIDILELESRLEELQPFKDEEIVTMCAGGGLSLVAVEILMEAGFMNVKSLKGGTDLWRKKGYPITTS